MSDLVKRLRDSMKDVDAYESHISDAMLEAADRIEALEAALREAYRHIDECCPHRVPNDARAALGEKKE